MTACLLDDLGTREKKVLLDKIHDHLNFSAISAD